MSEHIVPHHFENAEQAFQSSKLGLWAFLVTEILLFGGLFVAYITFRALYPEMFHAVSHHVSSSVYHIPFFESLTGRQLGTLNTVVLICSSFTMAMAVQKTRENKRNVAIFLLLITFMCACAFMWIKYQEYHHKFIEGLAPFTRGADGGLFVGFVKANFDKVFPLYPRSNLFYGLYFMMTGLHGVHVLVGMGLIGWVLIKSVGRTYSSSYYTPVELTGLYWHLVDLVWIFLFPLLYLVG